MEDAPKSFWGDPGPVDGSKHRLSEYDDIGLREEADLIHLFTKAGVPLREAEGMELWELAAATGAYLGPTMDEARIQEVYADEERVRRLQLERAKERQERQQNTG